MLFEAFDALTSHEGHGRNLIEVLFGHHGSHASGLAQSGEDVRISDIPPRAPLTPPDGKVDVRDGGFVYENGRRYWVSGPGHYAVIDGHKTWIPKYLFKIR